MRFAKVRLLIAVGLLAAWIGYIAYQALAFGRFPVVSHAQLLVSTLDVIADVRADADARPEAKVHVTEVHWPARKSELVGQDITISNMEYTAGSGFNGAGRYILPLVRGEGGDYRVAGLPRSPGFDGHSAYFIYPDTPLTRQQLDAIPKPVQDTTPSQPGK
jgi:hypothetical protein